MPHRSTLQDVLRRERGISRRTFLAYSGALSALPWLAEAARADSRRRVSFPADPFTLGVASGDPDSTGVVLWTRLAPKPLEPGGGLPPEIIDVQWEIARDEAMKDVVRRGNTVASPQLGHSVHAEVDGLEPDRWYWYRFRAGRYVSPRGRTRTAPAGDARLPRLRLGVANCQDWQNGYYTAFRRLAGTRARSIRPRAV